MNRPLRKNTKLTRSQIEHLLYGFTLLWTDKEPFENAEERRRAWFENREWLLSLEGIPRVPGVFGHTPLRKGEKPQAMKDYEGKKKK